MNSYQKIVDVLREASNTVNSSGRFLNGRIIDASAAGEGAYPLIVNYPFITAEDDNPEFENGSIELGFWELDTPDSTPEQMEAIVSRMATLADDLRNELHKKKYKHIKVTGWRGEPEFKSLSATLTGFAVTCTITVVNDSCN